MLTLFLPPPTWTFKSQSSVLERSLLVVFWKDNKFPDGELQYEVAECRVMLLFVPQHPFFQFTQSFRQKRGSLNTGASTTGNLSMACPLILYFLRPSWTLNILQCFFHWFHWWWRFAIFFPKEEATSRQSSNLEKQKPPSQSL